MKRIGKITEGLWRQFVRRWKHCRDCPLGEMATNHVLARGTVPCQTLLVGEAPGKDEDATGDPFIGRAGAVLDNLIEEVPIPEPYAIANLLCCAPWLDEDRNALRYPSPPEIATCMPHLDQLFDIALPKRVILLGKAADLHFRPRLNLAFRVKDKSLIPYKLKIIHVHHPAYLARKGGKDSREFDRVVRKLRQFYGSKTPQGV